MGFEEDDHGNTVWDGCPFCGGEIATTFVRHFEDCPERRDLQGDGAERVGNEPGSHRGRGRRFGV